MVQTLATRLAEYAVAHQWIEASYRKWCSYAIEKWLGKLIFAALFIAVSILTNSLLRMLPFIFTFLLLRRRQGGWHANHFWSCQIISIGMVLFVEVMLGPAIEQIQNEILMISGVLLIVCTFALRPAYPTSAHFSDAEKHANLKRRNQLLIGILILACLAYAFSWFHQIAYIFLGLAIADVSVLLAHIYSRKDCKL